MQRQVYDELKRCLEREELVALATVVDGAGAGRQLLVWPDTRISSTATLPPAPLGTLGSKDLDRRVIARAKELLRTFGAERRPYEVSGEVGGGSVDVFLEVHPPRPKLIIVGAVHVAIPLVTFAKTLGLRTVVVDPRTAFATPERFAHADALVTDWPDEALTALGLDENTFLALLSHDLKLDLPALRVALASPVRYIGALGSKKTHGKRVAALREQGVDEAAIARIHNPIGLDLGGRRAEEMAVAIIAEIVAVDHGRTLRPGP